ncbi:E3 ubiquitin-protein ligase RBBP6-like isoform X2 [Trichoplusia ni]|uniref:Mediator of DNA damage checkpoint protein 1 n=1 Tax=Trichoplusia ni TaxID=7111 RepID=A0A7E5WLC6_TRINI|nr:E3 ubiquitin-protein ligase RBBP6-like isoform X2 [Trichoplusia ni]
MECTQRLECTQELYDTHTPRVCAEQIGFVGICGEKHPVLRGPNKIGRDPQTCNIVLNLNSVSRQHAVINVLSSKEYMLMDLGSANKTKLVNKTLQPYIPYPLKNGDTVQFGDNFGIFRLLEEDDNLPMTQALDLPMTQPLDIPDTPLPSKAVSKIHKAQTTVIPESPDDDSFISASNRNSERTRLSSGQFIKPFGKTISIQPISSPKTPNNSGLSKRSTSLSFVDNPNTSLNESCASRNSKNVTDIHDMDTQPPDVNEPNDSIHTADTQIPPPRPISPSIYSLNTQLPTGDNLPEIRKVDNQQEMQFDLYAANKENDTSIFNAETQPFAFEKEDSMQQKKNGEKQNIAKEKVDSLVKANDVEKSINTSEEELLFDDIDGDVFEEDLNSQNILVDEVLLVEAAEKSGEKPKDNKTPSKRANRIESDSSTDCEDIYMMPTQKVAELPKDDSKQDVGKVDITHKVKPTKSVNGIQSDCSTDCEDIDMIPTQKIPEKKVDADDDVTDCEDNELPTNKPIETGSNTKFEDMPTQIIDAEYNAGNPANNNEDIEDQATQILEEIVPQDIDKSKTSLSKLDRSFKVPFRSPKRVKNKDVQKPSPIKTITSKPGPSTLNEDNYYQATQEIYDDLCSQREMSPDILQMDQGDNVTIDLVSSPAKKHEEALNKLQKSFSRRSGVKCENVASLKKTPSDSSDVDTTPKKLRPFLFTDSDLPSSQEITTSMMTKQDSAVVDLSSDSEPDNTEEQTPIVHRKKKTKPAPKLDLTKKFDVEMLPERILTRQRKPTDKLGNSTDKSINSKILKSTYLLDQEDEVDQEIISENIKRLKSFEKAKSLRESKNDVSAKEDVKDTSPRSKESKSKEPKEKIKVKIEKPKKKETKPKSESSVRKSDENKSKQKQSSITSETNTRKTRTKKNETETKANTKNRSVSPDSSKKEDKKPRNRRKERSKSPEIEVRRSKRQTTKEKSLNEPTSMNPRKRKPILKNVRESTEYNMSSSSGEPNRSLKRSLVEDSVVPSPKRTRSYVNSSNTNTSSGISNSSLRATPARLNKTHHVLFTAFPSDEVKQKLEKLGAVIVTDVMQCTVVLTMQIKRTFKLLCALGLGRPIVGPGWVQACNDTNIIVDPWLYLVKDESAEKRFGFNLERSLTGKRNFLKGYNVSSTPNVQPNATEMELIVKCSGGNWKEGGPHWVCVSCNRDRDLWAALRRRGASVVSTEFILGGVLKQTLDVAAHTFP